MEKACNYIFRTFKSVQPESSVTARISNVSRPVVKRVKPAVVSTTLEVTPLPEDLGPCHFGKEKKMKKMALVPVIFAAITSTILDIVAGFHTGWSSPILSKLLEDTSVPVTQDQASLIVSCFSIAAVVGPISMMLTVDRWGRKVTMILVAVTFLIAGVMLTFPQNYWWYYIGRLTCGFAAGNVVSVLPMYLAEIAEDRIRGGLSILITVMYNSGTVVAYSVGPWVSVSNLGAIGLVMPLVFLLLVPWMPETPYFYVMKGKPDLARRSLEFLRGTTDVAEEIERLKKSVEIDLQNTGTFKELLMDRANRKALLVILGILAAQQLSGISIILYYNTSIFNQVISNISSSTSVIITGVVQLIASLPVVYFADRIGRRPLVLGSMFFSVVFLAALSAYFHLQAIGNDVSTISWLPVTAMVGYLSAYAVGLGSMGLPILTELLPGNVKAYGIPVATTWSTIIGTVVSLVYPTVKIMYGNHTAFYSFTICVAVLIIPTFFYLPETKNKSLSEIQQMLRVRSTSEQKLEPVPTPECSRSNSIYCIAIGKN